MSRRSRIFAVLLLVVPVSIGVTEEERRVIQNAKKKVTPDGTIEKVKAFNPDFIQQGNINLNIACSRCHGKDGRGGKGPDLTDGVYRHAWTDREIVDVIANGIRGTGMPGLGAAYEDFYLPILAYIRSEGANSNRKPSAPSGDAARGMELFKKHKCASCHWVRGRGGRLGTNLSNVAATANYVRESMRYPDSQVDGTHQRVSLLSKDGRVLTGKRLSENTFDILLMDGKESLHSISKQDWESVVYHSESWMPSYGDLLSVEDIEDLTTYIFSLRKASTK